ncbi:augmin complex subunit dgt2 [Zeugodacus cucurbitae]|uniref:Succinyl-CoA ligase [ADP-forming] subunit beta n=1 Tax=Zeugodacus cucurbitae TaxID=28588 RepID=A0A0A1XRI9_ZEUCU|nr:augmin complex subunit dgt2 [Zeugodacus cucurbitae]XP_028894439.1 augmin complex subunit dgt2 [Zeugodacus cucurbitae]
MTDPNETLSILNAEARRQMELKRDSELCKIRKLRLVLDNLQKIRINKLDLPDSGEQVDHALKVLDVNDYLHMNAGGADDYLLGLKNLRESINLTYTERKAIREEITSLLRSNLQPVIDFGKKLKAEIPDVFAEPGTPPPTGKGVSTKASGFNQIISLESQRRSNLQKLVEARNRKCAYLKAAAELKMGPYLAHELELLHAQGRLTQEKSNILRNYFTNELLARTEHSAKALREVENYIDMESEKIAGTESN